MEIRETIAGRALCGKNRSDVNEQLNVTNEFIEELGNEAGWLAHHRAYWKNETVLNKISDVLKRHGN